MRKHLKTAAIVLLLASVEATLTPITSEARTTPRMVSIQTTHGKTVQLRTMKVGGEMMILVPMSMACDVFHTYIGGHCLGGV
jgi:hypothetical protein